MGHDAPGRRPHQGRVRFDRFMNGGLPIIILLAWATAFFVFSPFVSNGHASTPAAVLMINAYHPGYRWSDQLVQGVRDTLMAAAPQTRLYVEHLDSKRLYSPPAFDRLADLIGEKYRHISFNAVIAADNNSIRFLKKHRQSLFAGIPVVICGANDLNPADLDGMAPVTGVNEAADVRATIDLALKLMPAVRRIVVVNDTTPTGRQVHREIQRASEAFSDRIAFVYWDDLRREDLIRRLAGLNHGDMVLYTFLFKDRSGDYFAYDDSAQRICSASPVPVFGLWEFNLGHGIIGGKLVSGVTQGQAAGKMVLRILGGEKTDAIPLLMESPNRFAFDYRVLERFGFRESDLPADSLIINRPTSIYEAYRALIWCGIVAFAGMIILILFLLVNIDKRRKMERDLRESRQSLKSITDNIPGVVYQFHAAADGQYGLNYVNDKASDIFDLQPTPDTFFEAFSARIHEADRERFFTSIADAVAAAGPWHFQGRFVHPSDGVMWFSGSAVPRTVNGQIIFDGVLMDISELKKADAALTDANRMLRLVLDTIPVRVFWKDKACRYLGCNQPFAGDAGRSRPDELIGKDDFSFPWGTDQADLYRRDDLMVMRTGKPKINYEEPQTTLDNRTIWLQTSKVPMRDAQDNVIGVLGTYQDITERKLAGEELRKLRNYLTNIINSMPSVLVGVDTQGRVTQWNRQAEQMTGMTFEKVRSQPVARVFPRLMDEMDRIRTAITDRRVLRDLKIPRTENGETRFEDVTIFPLVANGIEGAVIRVDDVTDRVRMEEMVIQSEKMLSVGGLAAGMAHEINNPLAGILQNTAVLENRLSGDLPANRKAAETAGTTMPAICHYLELRQLPAMLDNIRTSGNRAAAIVKNMLSFARKSDRITSSHELTSLLDQTIELARTDYDMKKRYDFKQIHIVREYDDTVIPVPCEGSKIQQVFLNILKNGAEAMADRKVTQAPPLFVLRVKEEGVWVRVEIEDNGPGMDEKTRRRIFEPFFTTKPVGEGTGLGLSVSYFIITETHGGKMDVLSTDSGGTRFVISLPKAGPS